MPFTPYHFGPAACIGLPLNRYIDIPVFVLANVVIDLEPLAVMVFDLNYPLHGYFHTFLIGGLVGLLWGLAACPARPLFKWGMNLLRLPYQSGPAKMILSGLFGAALHVLFDAILYANMNPFWPIPSNPILRLVSRLTIYSICEISFLAAIVIYPAWAYCSYKRQKQQTRPSEKNRTQK